MHVGYHGLLCPFDEANIVKCCTGVNKTFYNPRRGMRGERVQRQNHEYSPKLTKIRHLHDSNASAILIMLLRHKA
jgi:hypothetical protein